MKRYFSLFPLIVGVVANQTFAQQEQISDPLVVDSATNFAEANVDRTVIYNGSNRFMAAVLVNADASYTGTDVNISISYPTPVDANSTYGIRSNDGKSVNLKTSGEDVWNTITASGVNVYGIAVSGASEVSRISNTEINVTGNIVHGIYASSSGSVELDNVNVHISSPSDSLSGALSYGIWASTGSRITNEGKGQVTIISDFAGDDDDVNAAILADNGSVDFHDATISVTQTALPTVATPFGVLTVMSTTSDSSISLKSSSIASMDGGVLAMIGGVAPGFLSVVDLDGVNLDNAKNQAILHLGESYLNLSNGTNYDGYMKDHEQIAGNLGLTITSGASWNVTQDSTTGLAGSLTLDGASMISFEQLSEGSFTNITSVSIALESGAILMLGATTEEIQALLDGNGGTYDVKLFTTDDEFSNEGVVLVTSDGQKLEYTTDNLGTYTLMSILPVSIPEPTTGALCLATFGLLALRRMKN